MKRSKYNFALYLVASSMLSIVSCSNNNDNSDIEPPATISIGILIDSSVGGVTYKTESQSGVTNEAGEFKYIVGEDIEFSIGDTIFPKIRARRLLTPIQFSKDADIKDAVVINSSVLLQSLDIDSNLANGINVPTVAAASSAPLDFTESPTDFVQLASLLNFVANSGSTRTEPVSPTDATTHLLETLSTINTEEIAIDTVSELLNSGATTLTSQEIVTIFTGNKFVSLDGRWDWEFFANGLSNSYALVEDVADFIDLPWSVEPNGIICRRENRVCVNIYKRGDIYRFGVEGDDTALEPWAITPVI